MSDVTSIDVTSSEMVGIDAGEPTGPVRFEPCSHFVADGDSPWSCCEGCGWLEADHETVAAVAHLPRRHLVERRAS